jgi:hypothetical protein
VLCGLKITTIRSKEATPDRSLGVFTGHLDDIGPTGVRADYKAHR